MYKIKILQENGEDIYPAVLAEGVVMSSGDTLEQYANDINAIASNAAQNAASAQNSATNAEQQALVAEAYSKAVSDALSVFATSSDPSAEIVAKVLDNTGNLSSIKVRVETLEEKVKCFDGTYNAEADLDIVDANGKVLARFDDGHFETKNFDTREAAVSKTQNNSALDICDQQGNVIARFNNGHVSTKYFDSSAVGDSAVKVVENASHVFDITDINGNVIVRLDNGHIKTKNFDSSNIGSSSGSTTPSNLYDVTSNFSGKRLAILGDSISSYSNTSPKEGSDDQKNYYGNYYPNPDGIANCDVNTLDKMWWKQVCNTLGMTYTNCSWNGSTVCTNADKDAKYIATGTSGFAGCSDKRITDLGRSGAPDIVICFISCNDWGRDNYTHQLGSWSVTSAIDTTKTTYTTAREAYAVMLAKIQTSYPNARIFCCSNLDDKLTSRDKTTGWPTNNSNGVTTYQWNQSIKEVAEALGATWLDMHGCGINYYNIANLSVDGGLHPNAAGHKLMANFITKQLIANY